MGEFLQNMYVWLWAALAILMIIVGIKYRHEHQGLLAVLMAVFFIFMTCLLYTSDAADEL